MGTCGWIGRTLIIAGLISGLFTSHTSLADEDCSGLINSWNKRYRDSYHVAWEIKEFTCQSDTGKLALTMSDLESLVFTPTSAGYRPDFQQIVTRNLRSLQYDDTCVGFLATGSFSSATIALCPAFFKDAREDRASTLVHEARHLEQGDPRHVTCVGGRFDGKPGACDLTFHNGGYEGSGYNMDVFFLNWVLKGSRQNLLRQSVLQGYLNSYIPDRFNNVTPEQLKKWRGN